MFRSRRRCSPLEDTLIDNHANRHWIQSYFGRQHYSTYTEPSFSDHSCRTSTSCNQIAMHPSCLISGGRFALWFCLLLLQQPHKGLGSLVTRDAIQAVTKQKNSLAPVNTFILHNVPLLKARQEHKRSTQYSSSKYESRRQPSGQYIPRFVRRGKKSSRSLSPPSSLGASSGKFSGLKSLKFSQHSTGVKTISRLDPLTGGAIMAVVGTRRQHHLSDYYSNGTYDDLFRNDRDTLRFPHPQQVQVFVDYINPYIKQSINPLQIQFIINQWHLFRQTHRRKRKMQRLQAAKSEEMRLQKQSEFQLSKPEDLNVKDALRREAQALKKATSFSEFKQILLRANVKSLTTGQIPISKNGTNFHEVDNGAISLLPKAEEDPIFSRMETEGKRSISKRSVYGNEFNKKEEMEGIQSSLLRHESLLLSRNLTIDAYVENETEEHSDEELREAYHNYNDFLSSACAPKNTTLCTKSLFRRDRVDRSTLFLPPGIYVKRCAHPERNSIYGGSSTVNSYQAMVNQAVHLRSRKTLKSLCAAADRMDIDINGATTAVPSFADFDTGGSCTCLLPEEECFPTEVRLKVAPVVVYNTAKGIAKTEVVALTEHVSCTCQRRCENRRCVSPLRLNNYTFDDCYCSCAQDDARCEALLDGKEKFTDEELPIPLNGSYILPPCYHGPMDEEHLYHRHCPRPHG